MSPRRRPALLAAFLLAAAALLALPTALAVDCSRMPGCTACEEAVVSGPPGRSLLGHGGGGPGHGPFNGSFGGHFNMSSFMPPRREYHAGLNATGGLLNTTSAAALLARFNVSRALAPLAHVNRTAIVASLQRQAALASVNRTQLLAGLDRATAFASKMNTTQLVTAAQRQAAKVNTTQLVAAAQHRIAKINATQLAAGLNRTVSLAAHMNATAALANFNRTSDIARLIVGALRNGSARQLQGWNAGSRLQKAAGSLFRANATRAAAGHDAGFHGQGFGNRTVLKCTACSAPEYILSGDRCVCAPGYGMPRPANGTAPSQASALPACQRCPTGLVSGPEAPQPTAPAAGSKGHFGGEHGGRGGHRAGPGRMGMCVQCPTGTAANADQTKCL